MSTPTYNALGVHIFAGGFTLGVKRHFNILGQFEGGDFGAATMAHNQPDIVITKPFSNWPAKYDELRERGVNFVYANPPCAPWSVAGHSYKHSRKKEAKWYERDPRTSCVFETFNVLEGVRPNVWAWESVCPALSKGRDMVEALTRRAHDLGYSATWLLINALDFGIAQRRKRFFCLFHNVELSFDYVKREPEQYTTVAQAWERAFGNPEGEPEGPRYKMTTYGETILSYTKPGEGLTRGWQRYIAENNITPELNVRGHVKGRPGFNSIRISLDKPAPTMIGGAHQHHPTQNRLLSVREAQVLCSYPPDYEFQGNLGDRYSQMAKAVMPQVGDFLARNVRVSLDRAVPTQGKTQLRDFINGRHSDVTLADLPEIAA